MEEEELELWFDEQKEKLTADYFKKIDETKGEDEEKKEKKNVNWDEAKIKAKAEFLNASRKLRDEYQKRYDQIKAKKDDLKRKKIRNKAIKKYSMIILGPLWTAIKSIGGMINFIFGEIWKIAKKASAKTGNAYYHSKEFYIFHVKSRLNIWWWPTKAFFRKTIVRPVKKKIELGQTTYANLIKSIIKFYEKTRDITIKYGKKGAEIGLKYSKLVLGRIGKVIAKINAFRKKFLDPIFAPLFKLLAKLKPKKNEDED